MEKKYRLLEDSFIIDENGEKLMQIMADKDILRYGVLAGNLGGFVRSEENLSQTGDCWVDCGATVSGDAHVCDNAFVGGEARVEGSAEICDDAEVLGKAHVSGSACLCGKSQARGEATVSGNALLCGSSCVCQHADVSDSAVVCDDAIVLDRAILKGNAEVSCNGIVGGEARVIENGTVTGDARVEGKATICGNAYVQSGQCTTGVFPYGIIDADTPLSRIKRKGIQYYYSNTAANEEYPDTNITLTSLSQNRDLLAKDNRIFFLQKELELARMQMKGYEMMMDIMR